MVPVSALTHKFDSFPKILKELSKNTQKPVGESEFPEHYYIGRLITTFTLLLEGGGFLL